MKRGAIMLAGCASLALSAPAFAQATDNGEGYSGIQDIVVTAQKRSENLQDVPVSVAALTSEALETQGVTSLETLTTAVPGITATRQSAATLIFIRGIGTTGGQAGQEGAVATFVDGVYQPSMSGSTFALNNIERIEVLKGPQGTLYGRNATGGAVNVITRDPSYDFTAEGEIGYGNRDTLDAKAYVSGGLIKDVVAIDLSGYYSDVRGGFGRNLITGEKVNTRKDWSIRSKLLIEPTEKTRIVVSGDYTENSGSFGVSFRPLPTTTRFLIGPAPQDFGNFWNIESDIKPFLKTKNYGASLRIEQEIGELQFTSLTAYRKLWQYQHLDLDAGPLPLAEFEGNERNSQFTQELQLSSAPGSSVQWILGAFYLDAVNRYDPWFLYGGLFADANGDGDTSDGVFGSANRGRQDTQSYAAFGQATFPLFSENTHLTLGARYTIDKRKFQPNAYLVAFDGTEIPLPLPNSERTFKKPTWRIAIDHKLNPDVLLYASYSRGFKSGVFNLTEPASQVVNPETLDAFEVGVKSDLLDRHLRLNLAGFYYKYKDIQLTVIRGAAQSLLNAAQAEVYGLDADFIAQFSDSFSISGGLQVIHARYGDFPGAPTGTVLTQPPFGVAFAPADGSGNRLIRTPDWTATIAADYKTQFAGGNLGINVSYAYNDGFFFEPDERLTQPAYSLVNAQVRWATADDHFYVKAYVRNLFEEKYWVQQTGVFLGDLGNPGYGRQFGGAVGFKF